MASRRAKSEKPGSPAPRRRIGFDARRALIVEAAREVFAEAGYAGASMEEIARRAGITKATLYDHFSSKQALHLWLLDRQREELNRLGQFTMLGLELPQQLLGGLHFLSFVVSSQHQPGRALRGSGARVAT